MPPGKLVSVFSTLTRVIAATFMLLPLTSCAEEEQSSPSAEGTEQPLTYVSLGDSLSVGVGASNPDTRGYTPLYRSFLEERSGRQVSLVELGISGETSESFINSPDPQLGRAESTLVENPGAVVTLSIGANDLLAAGGTDADRERVLVRYSDNLDHILRTLNSASQPAPRIIVLALYNPAPGSFTDEWAGKLNRQIRSIAQNNSTSVAAGDRAFKGHEAEYSHYATNPYDIHPTDKGYEALARAFADATNGSSE